MAPSDEEVRTALEMIPINILRKMIDERELGVTSRSSDDLIHHLVEDGWTDEDYQSLKHRLVKIEREKQPFRRYVVYIDSFDRALELDKSDHERIETILGTNPSEFDGSVLAEPGFEIDEVSEKEVTGVHWTKSLNHRVTPLNEIKTDETVYKTGFTFDLDDNILLIDCSLPAKASNLITVLEHHGIDTKSVGHDGLATQTANQYVQDFVDDLKERLLDVNDRAALDPNDTGSVLEVDLVEMLVDEAELEDIRIGGRTDIIGNPAVEDLLEDHDARVVRLEGQFRLDGTYYNFTTGYTDDMGQVSVEKQGRVEERPELAEEAFEFIYESYDRYFVDV